MKKMFILGMTVWILRMFKKKDDIEFEYVYYSNCKVGQVWIFSLVQPSWLMILLLQY